MSLPPRDNSRMEARKFWDQLDKIFFDTLKIAEITFKTNRVVNIIIVIIGILLIINSIAYTWYKNEVDAWSIFSGGIGILAFLTNFFFKPQDQINKALSNLAQIQMIYKMHALEFESIADYDREKTTSGNRDIKEVSDMNKELERTTECSIDLIKR